MINIWDKLKDILAGKVPAPKSRLDVMFDEMQTPEAQEAIKKAFDASPQELGEAAVKQAQQKQCTCGSDNICNIYDICPDCKNKRIIYE